MPPGLNAAPLTYLALLPQTLPQFFTNVIKLKFQEGGPRNKSQQVFFTSCSNLLNLFQRSNSEDVADVRLSFLPPMPMLVDNAGEKIDHFIKYIKSLSSNKTLQLILNIDLQMEMRISTRS